PSDLLGGQPIQEMAPSIRGIREAPGAYSVVAARHARVERIFGDSYDSVFQHARREPFLDQAENARVGNPMLNEARQPFSDDFIKEASDVNLEYPVHLGGGDSNNQRIQRIVLAALGPEPVRKSEEIFLVDRVQHRGGRSLDDFVFQSTHRNRPL